MAVSDRTLEMLTNSINQLVTGLKNDKNSFGSNMDGGSRMGRGGSSNGRSATESNKTVQNLANNLEELHKAMKSGGKTIAEHFKETIKNIHPLNQAFSKLDDVVRDAAENQSKIYAMAAKKTVEYVKSVGGNIDEIKQLNKEYSELVSNANDIVDNQASYANNQELVNKKLAIIQEQRTKLEKKFNVSNLLNGSLDRALKKLGKDATSNISEASKEGLRQLNEQHRAVSEVSKTYLKDITNTLEGAQKNFKTAINNFTKSVGAGVLAAGKDLPGISQSRLQYGFQSNEFMQSAGMGLSYDELNQFRSTNRDIINALSGFGKSVDAVSDGTLKQWANQAKSVGLIGKEAADFTQNMMRNAYATGRTFDGQLGQTMTDQAMIIQQSFGGSITDASKMLQDFSSQIYNINRFNRAQTAEQQAAVQKELTQRALYTKYLGYDVEYMKQREMMRHNQSFADIGDRIRQSIMTTVGLKAASVDAGLTQAEIDAMSAQQLGGGSNLTDAQIKAIQSAEMKLSDWKTKNERANAVATQTGGLSVGISSMLPQYAAETMLQRGGLNIQEITDKGQAAAAERRSRGDISFDDYLTTMESQAAAQAASFGTFDAAVMEFSESVRGITGLPGGSAAAGIAGSAADVAKTYIMGKFGVSALGTIFGGKGGAAAGGAAARGILPRVGAALLGGGAAATTLGVTGAAVGGGLVGTGLQAWGSDAYHSDNAAYKLGTAMTNPLGYGSAAFGGYMANRNQDSWVGAGERVAQTGMVTEDDIRAFTDKNQLGKWFTSDEEDAADRQAAIDQLTLLANANRANRGLPPLDMSRGNGIAMSADSMNGIQRDANGNPIPQGGSEDKLGELVEINRRQLDVALEVKTETQMREERQNALASQRTSVKEHMENMAGTITGMFTV